MRDLLLQYLGERWSAALGDVGIAHIRELLSGTSLIRAAQLLSLPLRAEELPALSHRLRQLQRFLEARGEHYPELSLDASHQLTALPSAPPFTPAKFLDAYGACLSEAMKGATLFADALQPEAIALEGHTKVSDLHPPRWLALRRAERDKRLRLSLTLPESEIEPQVELRFQGETPKVLERLRPLLRIRVFAQLDEMAHEEALEEAARSYRSLLLMPPLATKELLAAFVGAPQQAIGVVHLSGERLIAHQRFEPKQGWQESLLRWVKEHRADNFLLPMSALDQARLRELRGLLSGTITPVKPAGLSEARALLQGEEARLSKEIASALILARRALRPFESWSAISPLALGLAEYQNDLPEEPLRLYLEDVFASCAHIHQAVQAAPSTHTGKLNPLLRSIADLKPGMMIEGEVVNLASFGAFVSMGLESDGLIHVSEISEQRIRSPSEVLTLGQRVRPRVLSVDLTKKKVSLSLRDRSKDRPTQSKADALAKLKKAFG